MGPPSDRSGSVGESGKYALGNNRSMLACLPPDLEPETFA